MAKGDPRDFLLCTDYEMDKIVYFTEGELDTSQYSASIPHNLGFAPLVFGVWSYSKDFSDSRTLPYSVTTQSGHLNVGLSANSDYISLGYTSSDTAPQKVYYRVYAFEPSDSYTKVGATSKYARDFILNTDYNYCKLFKKGVVNSAATQTIAHNLGYIPQVLAWGEGDYGVEPIETSVTEDRLSGQTYSAKITTTQVIFDFSKYGLYKKIHYRIYYDEA